MINTTSIDLRISEIIKVKLHSLTKTWSATTLPIRIPTSNIVGPIVTSNNNLTNNIRPANRSTKFISSHNIKLNLHHLIVRLNKAFHRNMQTSFPSLNLLQLTNEVSWLKT